MGGRTECHIYTITRSSPQPRIHPSSRPLGLLLLFLLLVGIVAAANDPGHDTLYVLKVGDNMTGSLNLTGSVTASYLRTASLIYGNYLDIWANGTLQSVTSRPAIQAPSANSLYIDSTQNIYIATMGGTTGLVQFGPTNVGNVLIVNVSGTLLQQNVKVCLANGSNCLSGNNTGNITSINAGNGISVSNPNGPATTIAVNYGSGLAISGTQLVVDNTTVCRSTGMGCPAGTSLAGSGSVGNLTIWSGNSTTLASSIIYQNANNVGIGTTIPAATLTVNSSALAGSFLVQNTTGSNHLFINGSTGNVGIGTATPTQKLDVNGSLNVSGNVYDSGNRVCTSANGLCGSGGANVSGSGTTNYVARWSNTTSLSKGALYDNGTNVGIGTTAPDASLDVHGTAIINSSANTGSLQVINTTGSSHFFINGTSGNVGIGTVTPSEKLSVVGNISSTTGAYFATSSGSVGIGTMTPVTRLDVNGSMHSSAYESLTFINYAGGSSTVNGTFLAENAAPFVGDTGGGALYGAVLHPKITSTNTAAFTYAYGAIIQPTIDSSAAGARVGVVGQTVYALRGNANDSSSYSGNAIYGSVTQVGHMTLAPSTIVSGSVYSSSSYIYNYAGTITNAYGFYNKAYVGNASGPANPVIGTYYGLKLDPAALANGGTITNNYGVYSADTTATNYFGGNVGIGTVSPAGAVTVNSSNAAGSLFVYNTTGSNHLFVNGSNGFVGIGTTTPGVKLDVSGQINSNRATFPAYGLSVGGVSKAAVFYDTTNSVLQMGSGALNNGISVTSDGSVGIGTTTPSVKLDVNGSMHSSAYESLTFINYAGSSSTVNGTFLAENAAPFVGDTSGGTLYGAVLHPKITSTNTAAFTYAYGAIIQPTIDSSAAGARVGVVGQTVYALRGNANDSSSYSGNAIYGSVTQVGHMTLAPSTIVSGSVYGSLSYIYNYAGTITNAYGFYNKAYVGNAGGPANPVIGTYYGLKLDPATLANGGTITNNYGVYSADTTATNYFAGNVGIGTTGPSATLTVNSSNAAGSFLVQNTTGSAHFFVNGSTGSVGIGTTTPSVKLDVNGAMHSSAYEPQTYTTWQGSPSSANIMFLAENAAPFVGDTSGGTLFGAVLHPKITSTNTTAFTQMYGAFFQPTIDSSAAGARLSVYGQSIQVLRDNANDSSSYSGNVVYGSLIQVGHYTTAPSTIVSGSAFGSSSFIYDMAGTITNAYGFYNKAYVGNAGGPANPVIGTYYGLKLDPATLANGGTITNNYGVYSADTTATNYFGGNVGIGTTTPTQTLDVRGSMNVSNVVYVQASTQTTCNAAAEGAIYYNSSTHKHYGCNSTAWNALY